MQTKPTWKELLARGEPLLLPCAYDALSARLIERAGFVAYAVGGYALVGARHALPDIGLVGFGEMSAGIRDIMAASNLPVLVDCDDARQRLVYAVTSERVRQHSASVQVIADGDGHCRLVWTVDVLPHDIAPHINAQMDLAAAAMRRAFSA